MATKAEVFSPILTNPDKRIEVLVYLKSGVPGRQDIVYHRQILKPGEGFGGDVSEQSYWLIREVDAPTE